MATRTLNKKTKSSKLDNKREIKFMDLKVKTHGEKHINKKKNLIKLHHSQFLIDKGLFVILIFL